VLHEEFPYTFVIAAENSIAAAERKNYFVVAKHRHMPNLDSGMRKFDVLPRKSHAPERPRTDAPPGNPGARGAKSL
jgi:hypothetical protein